MRHHLCNFAMSLILRSSFCLPSFHPSFSPSLSFSLLFLFLPHPTCFPFSMFKYSITWVPPLASPACKLLCHYCNLLLASLSSLPHASHHHSLTLTPLLSLIFSHSHSCLLCLPFSPAFMSSLTHTLALQVLSSLFLTAVSPSSSIEPCITLDLTLFLLLSVPRPSYYSSCWCCWWQYPFRPTFPQTLIYLHET